MNKETTSRLLSTVAHDLKNPLAAIQSTAELLSAYHHRMAEEEQLKQYHRILNASHSLRLLLEEAMRYAELRLLDLPPEITPVDAGTFVTEITHAVESRNECVIQTETPPEITVLNIPATALKEILIRLMQFLLSGQPGSSVCGQLSLRLQQSSGVLTFLLKKESDVSEDLPFNLGHFMNEMSEEDRFHQNPGLAITHLLMHKIQAELDFSASSSNEIRMKLPLEQLVSQVDPKAN